MSTAGTVAVSPACRAPLAKRRCLSPRRLYVSSYRFHCRQMVTANHSVKCTNFSVTTGWYRIHALRFTSPLQTKDRYGTYSVPSALLSTAASRYSTTSSTTAIALYCQKPTATFWLAVTCSWLERHCTGYPVLPVNWNDVKTQTFVSSGHDVQAATFVSSALRLAAGSSHSFRIV